jgi:hypothetical protein
LLDGTGSGAAGGPESTCRFDERDARRVDAAAGEAGAIAARDVGGHGAGIQVWPAVGTRRGGSQRGEVGGAGNFVTGDNNPPHLQRSHQQPKPEDQDPEHENGRAPALGSPPPDGLLFGQGGTSLAPGWASADAAGSRALSSAAASCYCACHHGDADGGLPAGLTYGDRFGVHPDRRGAG